MPNSPIRLLVVDDEIEYREVIRAYFTHHGYGVQEAGNGDSMWNCLARYTVDMILLDVMLPGKDGLQLLREVREQYPEQAIILLSNLGQEEVERIVGLELGADAYLGKNTSLREILAHVKTVLRRKNLLTDNTETTHTGFADYKLDYDRHCLYKHNDAKPIPLTLQEFNLLLILLAHPQQVLHREELLRRLKGYDYQPFDRSIDVMIKRLRSKIEENPHTPQHIRTVRGKGYMFVV